jgi:hypothetical protein
VYRHAAKPKQRRNLAFRQSSLLMEIVLIIAMLTDKQAHSHERKNL